MKCPHCKKEVDALRGDCPHCEKDLNAEGLRTLLEENKTGIQEIKTTEEQRKTDHENALARIAILEEKLKESAEREAVEGATPKPRAVNMGNVIRACINGGFDKNSGYEEKVIKDNAERMEHERALSSGAVGTGGAVVPPEYLPQEMIDILRSKLIIESLGATVLDGLTGSPVTIPRLSGSAVPGEVAENAAKPETDQTFELLSLAPNEVAAATRFSKRLLLLSNPSIDKLVQKDLMEVVARRIDLMSMFGTGAANQPTGIVNTGGVGTYTIAADVGNGGIPVAEDVDGMELVLEEANAMDGKPGFAMSPRSKNTFRTMRDESGGAGTTTGGWLFRQDIKEGNLDDIPLGITTQIPNNLVKGASGAVCSRILLGNWEDLILGFWGGLEIAASDTAEGTFLKNQVIIKVAMLYDVGLRHPESFVSVDGVLA